MPLITGVRIGYSSAVRPSLQPLRLSNKDAGACHFGEVFKRTAQAAIQNPIYPLNHPFPAEVKSVNKIIARPDRDIYHVELNMTGSRFRHLSGQNLALIFPDGKPRFYSIASPMGGEDGHHRTIALTVKYAKASGKPPFPIRPGQPIQVAGPFDSVLIPPPKRSDHVVLLSTGVGFAKFRSLLLDRLDLQKGKLGQTWLYTGYPTREDVLYPDLIREYTGRGQLCYRPAFSRESAQPGPYVQNRLLEDDSRIWSVLKAKNTYIYICGLPNMVAGIENAVRTIAARHGTDGNALLNRIKTEGRWRVEVY